MNEPNFQPPSCLKSSGGAEKFQPPKLAWSFWQTAPSPRQESPHQHTKDTQEIPRVLGTLARNQAQRPNIYFHCTTATHRIDPTTHHGPQSAAGKPVLQRHHRDHDRPTSLTRSVRMQGRTFSQPSAVGRAPQQLVCFCLTGMKGVPDHLPVFVLPARKLRDRL